MVYFLEEGDRGRVGGRGTAVDFRIQKRDLIKVGLSPPFQT